MMPSLRRRPARATAPSPITAADCRACGPASPAFFRSIASARATRARVACGMITSSMYALGGDERRKETVLVFLGAGGDLAGIADVGAENDLHRSLAPITAICAVGQA